MTERCTVTHCSSHEKTTGCFKLYSAGNAGLALNPHLPNEEQTNYPFSQSRTRETKAVVSLWQYLR